MKVLRFVYEHHNTFVMDNVSFSTGLWLKLRTGDVSLGDHAGARFAHLSI